MKRIFTLACVLLIGASVAVHAQIVEDDPIVIIPGTMASWNSSVMLDPTPTPSPSDWNFTPAVKQYNQLIQSLKDAGLVEGEDFFIAFYDWRQRNADSATNYLLPVIDQALAHSSSGKVDIVAHSMGGLVARSYIQSDAYRGDIDQFIMLGTPNRGSSDVYTLWEGGFVPENWNKAQKAILQMYLWYSTVTGASNDAYDTIHTYIPSIQELLPTYDYLVDKDSGLEIDADDMQERNLYLEVLNLEDGISALRSNVSGGVSIIAGEDHATVGTIPVVPHIGADGALWIDGKPDPLSPELNDTDGDNRVLIASAFLEDQTPVPSYNSDPQSLMSRIARLFIPAAHAQFLFDQIEIESKHGDLPTTSIDYIFDILDLGTPVIAYQPEPEPDEILSFWFASPIDVQVTAPSGGVVSKQSNTIPGATYTGSSDPFGFKMVVIENPEAGQYGVALEGLADGTYHVGVGSFTSTADTVADEAATTAVGQHITYTVQYEPTDTDSPVEISEPVIEDPEEEPTALERLDELKAFVQALHDAASVRDRKAFKVLLGTLNVAKYLIQHERPVLAIGSLKIFELEVKNLQKKNILTATVASDLLQRSSDIRTVLQSPQN